MEPRRTTRSTRARNSGAQGASIDDVIGEYGGARVAEDTRGAQSGQGTGLVGKVKERATAQLSTQKNRATDQLGTIVQAVRHSGERLREDQHATVAQYVENAAEQLERFSATLREKDVNELVQDAQRLARRQPALFIGGSFVAGLLAARFLKSTPERAETHAEYRAPETGEYRTSETGEFPGGRTY